MARAQAATVRVHGLREVNRAFAKIDKEIVKSVKDELVKVAEPVALDSRQRIGHYQGASTSTIVPIGTMRGAIVRQKLGKRSGLRPDFGVLQMGHMVLALEANETTIENAVEDLVDLLGRKAGF